MIKPTQRLALNHTMEPNIPLEQEHALDPFLIQKISSILRDYFHQEINVKAITVLSEPLRRNKILRIHLDNPLTTIPETIIFKQTIHQKDDESDVDSLRRFSRDWAGLEFLSHLNYQHSPHFYGGSIGERFVLLEDLGAKHVSLVDSLTDNNYVFAKSALYRFAKSLGQFHAAGHDKTQRYTTILHQLDPSTETWQKDLDRSLGKSMPKIQSLLEKLNISLSNKLRNEINNVLKSNIEPSSFRTLVHGDICPDNVFDNPLKDELHLIDFEHASLRSALLDGTYFRMSMPTCWCALAIPPNIILELEKIYREELKNAMPPAHDDDAYDTAYVNACAFWAVDKAILFIEDVFDKERVAGSGPTPPNSLWQPEKNLVRPRIVSRLQAFIEVSTNHKPLATLRQLAQTLLSKLYIVWPELEPLKYYPAFENGQRFQEDAVCN